MASGETGKDAGKFDPGISVEGRIAWFLEGEIGAKCDQTIDVDQVLSNLARYQVKGRVNRAPQLQIQSAAELLNRGRTLAIDCRTSLSAEL